ncbi:hypothetical protein K0P33_16040 [Pseudomonas sp. ArH3a]|nr:hypothetical protein [Pseudomonas sp. ArH3a]UNM17109.1 hypothetical protein K0P33_16040 [Pseudomonas sp. ArH3a]
MGGRKAAETDTYIINDKWRPFNVKIDKQIRKVAAENCKNVDETAYKMSAGSMGQVFAVCGSFFQYTIDEGLTADANPIRSVKQKSNFKQRNTVISSGKALTPLQWNYVIETAEVMAAEDPRHERTLFIVATLFLSTSEPLISSVGTTGSLQWVRSSTTVKTGGSTLSVRATRPRKLACETNTLEPT